MALTPGTRLGSYEVAEPIGQGGMGEVYRAHDMELARDVAIKVLPESFAADAGRVARFEREAKTLAALNHPNIAQIYGIERSAGMAALIMELVAGPTLADRIAEGPIPPDEAQGIAMQIAAALEAAHGQQIIHRDLKPANVKLTPDGVVKLLDFGIAKVPESAGQSSGGRTPTLLTPAATEAGVLLGTAAYMAPEQARGRAIDERADIWGFGCVLYEMLTGQPAFGGEDVTTTLARVLEREADLDALPASVSPAVKRTIALCLEKEPRNRVRDIGDVRLALEGRFETERRYADGAAAAAERARPIWRRALPIAATAAVAALIAIPLGRELAPVSVAPAAATVTRFAQTLPNFRGFVLGDRSALAIAPDGASVAFTLDQGIYLRTMGALEPRLIRGTEGGELPFFSPDGQWLGFSLENELYKVPIAGGIPVDLGQQVGPYGVAWLEDGTIVYSRGFELRRVSADGGDFDVVASPSDGKIITGPSPVRGTDWLLYSEADPADLDSADVVALSLASGERKVVFTGGSDVRYTSSGHLLYVRGNALYAAPFDLESLTTTAAGLPVVDGLSRSPIVSRSGNYDVSNDGTLAYLKFATTAQNRELVWVDRAGREERIPVTAGSYDFPRVSPDGRRVVVTASDGGGPEDLLVLDLARNVFTPATDTNVTEIFPAWMPDSQRIVYHIPAVGQFIGEADGSGTPAPIVQANYGWPQMVSADSAVVLVTSVSGTRPVGGSGGIGAIALGPRIADDVDWLVEPARGQYRLNVALSPDKHWLAYQSNETVEAEIFVRAYPDVEHGLQRVSVAGGMQPVWNPDGAEIFYIEPGSPPRLMSVSVEASDPLTLSEPRPVIEWPYVTQLRLDQRGYDVDPSGQRFLALKSASSSVDDAQHSELNIVQNWFVELERLVPAGQRSDR